MWSISLLTLRDRWTLFVGALLSIALGVALVQSSTVLLVAANATRPGPGASPGAVRDLHETVDGVTSLMGISLTLGLFLSVFIIGSTLSFTVVERRRDLALLRLSGASRRQVRRLLLGEGLLLGLLGTALGAVLGLPATAVELRLIGRLGLDTGLLDLTFPARVLAFDLAAGLGSALLGLLVAARRAGRTRPLDALRATGDQRRVMTVGRWVWALLCGVPAVVGAVLAQASGDVLVAILAGVLVILAGSIALQQLSPLVVPLVARLFAVLGRRHVLADLAQAGMRDGVRRSATTAGPVIVLVGLVVGLLGILATQTEATRVERLQQTSAQLVVLSHGDVSADLRRTPGVAVASPQAEVSLPVRRLTPAGRWVAVGEATVTAVDPASYAAVTSMHMSSGSLRSLGSGRAALGPAAGEDGLGRPHEVSVGGRRLVVVARMAATIAGGEDVVVDRRDVPASVLSRAPTTTFVRVTPGASLSDVRARLAGQGRVASVAGVTAWADRLAREEADTNDLVMESLAGLGGLYAFLSLVNAVAIGTAQRKRELAVVRVSGGTRRQVVGTAALESCGVGLIGVALGAAVAAWCLVGVRHGTASTLGVPVLVVPWRTAIGIALAAPLAAATTAALAAWAATRTPPVRLVAARE
jgi:putative ABC transport system permease protein